MFEAPESSPPAAAAPAPTPRPPRRGSPGALLLASLALAGTGVLAWRQWQAEAEHAALRAWLSEAAELATQDAASGAREREALREELAATARRVADAAAVNAALREELLGLGERARLLEDAVANLAEQRLAGAEGLTLDEVDYLLRLGVERLALFHDPDGTIAAFRLADARLATLDDAAFAGVRQTLAGEIQVLSTVAGPDLAARVGEIDTVIAALPGLPTRVEQDTAAAAPAPGDGVWRRLGEALAPYVRVRRLEGGDAALINPLSADTVRASIALELTLAKAAAIDGDGARWRSALAQSRRRLAAAFATEAPAVAAALERLDHLAERDEAAELPAVGRALEELRNLRATRSAAVLEGPEAP